MNNFYEALPVNRLLTVFGLLTVAMMIGTVGYALIEDWPLLDAFYMTVITLATVGFGEVRPLSAGGRLFTVFLIVGGIGIVAYASTSIVEFLVSANIQEGWLARRRQRMLDALQDHYIVCGFGRVGGHVAAELNRQQKPFVVIAKDEGSVERCHQFGYHVILGDAADEQVLEAAGIWRARSLISAVSSDAENVFIVLTARSMRQDLVIVSRANSDYSEPKLLRAGANRVIEPYAISGRRMVSSVDYPAVVDFLDIVMHSPGLELRLADLVLTANSPLVGQSLRQSHLRSRVGVNVLGMRLPGHPLTTQPAVDVPLAAGTHMIVLGTAKQLAELTRLVNPDRPATADTADPPA